MRGWKRWLVAGLVVIVGAPAVGLVGFVLMVFWYQNYTPGSYTVWNGTEVPIVDGAVSGMEQYIRSPVIPPGRSHTFRYFIRDEHGMRGIFRLQTGELYCGGTGYTVPLVGNREAFVIGRAPAGRDEFADADVAVHCGLRQPGGRRQRPEFPPQVRTWS